MYANAAQRYADAGISTAGPAKLLTMLYDRLVLDLQRAENAMRAGDVPGANAGITHAQDILVELRATLKTDVWSGAAALASLYSWWLSQLVQANVRKDAETTATVRRQVEPLRDAWHEAARAAQPALATA